MTRAVLTMTRAEALAIGRERLADADRADRDGDATEFVGALEDVAEAFRALHVAEPGQGGAR